MHFAARLKVNGRCSNRCPKVYGPLYYYNINVNRRSTAARCIVDAHDDILALAIGRDRIKLSLK